MVLSGLWMWKGHVLRRLVSKRPAGDAGSKSPRFSATTRPRLRTVSVNIYFGGDGANAMNSSFPRELRTEN